MVADGSSTQLPTHLTDSLCKTAAASHIEKETDAQMYSFHAAMVGRVDRVE